MRWAPLQRVDCREKQGRDALRSSFVTRPWRGLSTAQAQSVLPAGFERRPKRLDTPNSVAEAREKPRQVRTELLGPGPLALVGQLTGLIEGGVGSANRELSGQDDRSQILQNGA